MVETYFIKKVKIYEGINALDIDAYRDEIPSGYAAQVEDPTVVLGDEYAIISFKVYQVRQKEKTYSIGEQILRSK